MVDYQRIVDEIRSFLQSTDQTLTDQVKEWAAGYAEACREANARLRRCEEFLQKGLRSEAIHLAQAEPVLLDLLAVLDFPERSQWEEVIFTYNLPSPPKINIASAEALNEAYTSVLPLEQLLRKHRLLALTRASLPDRLAVMRQIAQLDGNNPIWAEDIGEFEKARIRQMEGELEHALQTSDMRALNALLGEVRTTQWVTSPPLQLVQRVEDLAKVREQKRFREALYALEAELHEAVGACDVERVKRLRDRWNAEALRGHLRLNDLAWDRVNPAFDWLDRQEERLVRERKHQAAVRELERALKEGASKEELEAIYRDVGDFNGGAPAELEEAYLARLDRLRRASARVRKNVLIGVAVALLVIAGAVCFLVYREIQANHLADAVQSLKRMLEADDISSAAKYMEELDANHAGIANAPELEPLRAQIEKKSAEERLRVEEFQTAFKDAERAPLDDKEKLAKVRGLTRTPKEKTDLYQLERKRAEQLESWRQKQDQDFRARAGDLETRIKALLQVVTQSLDAPTVTSDFAKIQADVAALEKDKDRVSDDARKALDPIKSGLSDIRRRLDMAAEEKDLVSKLAGLVRLQDGERYVLALKTYLDKFAGTARAKDFEQVWKERGIWQGAIEWTGVIDKSKDDPFRVSFGEAKLLGDTIKDFRKRHPQFVDDRTASQYQSALEAITQQDESLTKSAATQLRQLFADPLVGDLWSIVEKGKRYYSRKDPRSEMRKAELQERDRFEIDYLAGFDDMRHVKTEKKGLSRLRISGTGRAPQSLIAEKVKAMPKHFADGGWDRATISIALMVLESKDIDAIPQLSLVRETLGLAAKGSYPLALALETHLQTLKDFNQDLQVPWFNPDSDSADRVRSFAKKKVSEIPPLTGVVDKAAAKKREIEAAIVESCREPVGWLAWDQEKKRWECRSEKKLDSNRVLWVVRQKEQVVYWDPIGKVADGRVILDPEKEPDHRQGRVVFVSR
jgi:hypothetical protein